MGNVRIETLEREITRLIIDTLNMEDVSPADIDPTEPLFASAESGGGLGLDSIDALEIGIALQKRFGIKIKPQDDTLVEIFSSVRSLATFIASQQGIAS
jgi:acyl carrier protein